MNAAELVRQMTLEEKVELLNGEGSWHIKNCPRLGTRPTMVSDGPHGLRKQVDKEDNMGLNGSVQAVCFPSAAGMASSFNPRLLQTLGETLGRECRAEGLSILLGPAVNIKRSPLCGRNFEYFSEDPYLTGELAASYVRGVQSQGVGTSVKHFAANNQEYRRMSVSSVVDERTLREIYLSAFEAIVKKAEPWTIMCSYNRVNGVYSSENEWLLNQVLRREWGFQGYVMTDWGAANDRVKGVPAGCDLEMPDSGGRNTKRLLDAVWQGRLPEQAIDRAAERILECSLRYLEQPPSHAVFDRKADHQTARELAQESMVLLKNENNLLPLSPGKKIAFLGAFAQSPRYQGGGSSHINPTHVTSALYAARQRTEITFAPGYRLDAQQPDTALVEEALAAAKQADVAVIFAGLTDQMESEGYDRRHLDLPAAQNALITAAAKVQPNLVVVLHNGSPVLMPWLSQAGAVLEAYLGGEACGEAVADLLFGQANPSGKLAETFPLSLGDTPCYNNFPGNPLTVEYREGVYVGYRYYDTAGKKVLFPFGHGLSYTTFAYSALKLGTDTLRDGDSLRVTFTLQNTGERHGAEAAQLYIAPPKGGVFRPVQELRGFEKVFLEAGEAQNVTLTLPWRAFAYYDANRHDWAVPGGRYEIRIGASSRDIRLTGAVEISGEDSASFYNETTFPTYASAQVHAVPDEEFERLLGRPIPPAHLPKGIRFTLENSLDDARDTTWGRRLSRLLAKMAGEKYGAYMEAVLTAPLRVMIGFAGLFREKEVLALLDLMNNEHVPRALAILAAWAVKRMKQK